MSSAALIAFPQKSRGPREALHAALKNHRVPDVLAANLAREADAWPGYDKSAALACALACRMRPAPIDFAKARAILLVGPRGAGKSAVAGKIAHMAEAAGRAVERRTAENGLGPILAGRLAPGHLAIVDSEGFNPRNARARAAFSSLDAAAGLETIGIVSALADAEETADVISSFGLGRVIVTGLDMARRLGTLTAASAGGARLAHVTHSARADVGLETLAPDALAALLLQAV